MPLLFLATVRHKVFRMLLAKEKITEEMIRMLSSWRHSGFHVFCGNRISPNDKPAMENLARYIIRASFSQERTQYLDQASKCCLTVIYTIFGISAHLIYHDLFFAF
ncbi:MAG: transposase [Proteobacteria bacterium]|nr:transposase [Pseudomonadota bacterium]